MFTQLVIQGIALNYKNAFRGWRLSKRKIKRPIQRLRSPKCHRLNKPLRHKLTSATFFCFGSMFLSFRSFFLFIFLFLFENLLGFLVEGNGISNLANGLTEHFLKYKMDDKIPISRIHSLLSISSALALYLSLSYSLTRSLVARLSAKIS